MTRIAAIDIDGTLVHHDATPNYLDPISLLRARPDLLAVKRVRDLITAGTEIHYVTGRTHAVRDATHNHLELLLGGALSLECLHTAPRWGGYAELRRYKAETLRRIGASYYVGDHDADRLAAGDAGIPFVHVGAFRGGWT